MINDNTRPDNNLYKWPDDYELHALGTFNPRTGEVTGTNKVTIITGEAAKVR